MKLILLFLMTLVCASSCSKPSDTSIEWIWGEGGGTQQDPDEPVDPDDPVTPDVPGVTTKGKSRMVWIDASANFVDYANDAARIDADMKRLKETGFTAVVVDVRPTSTGVLFSSKTEAPLKRAGASVGGRYKYVARTADFDYLQAFINAGEKHGVEVYAAINTMVGAVDRPYGLGKDGFLYEDSSKKGWATILNSEKGLVSIMDKGEGAKFLNPANDEVVDYLLNLLGDLAAYKGLKGIILDRCRYSDDELMSDFSDESRTKFEQYIGRKVSPWPAEIFSPGQTELSLIVTPIQKLWLEFRAKTIHDFIEKASDRVHSINPNLRFGAYVGAWYSSYYYSGVNWASPKYMTNVYYPGWASSDYHKYGYADHCDIMLIGAYASATNIYGSGEWTMQGFCRKAEKIFAGDVPFVGGPDVGNSSGFENGGKGSLMPQIVDACINSSTGGMFFFDLSHIKKYDYWSAIKNAFDQYLETVQ